MGVPKRAFAEFSQSVPPTAQTSGSAVYTASNFTFTEETLVVPITGTVNPFILSAQTGVFLITKVSLVSAYNLTASVSLRQGSTVLAGPFTHSNMVGSTLYTMSLAANAREVVAFGGAVCHFSSSVVTGTQAISGQVFYKKQC